MGAEDSSQGAQRSTSMKEEIEVMVEEAEQQVMEELRAQRIYTAWFSYLLCWLHHHILVVMKTGHTLLLALKLGAWLMPSPLSSS